MIVTAQGSGRVARSIDGTLAQFFVSPGQNGSRGGWYRVVVQRTPTGNIDTDGQDLHIRTSSESKTPLIGSDQSASFAEYSPDHTIWIPCGQVEFVGGIGDWIVEMYAYEARANYEPRWTYRRSWIRNGVSVQAKAGETAVSSLNGTIDVQTSTASATTLRVSDARMPVVAGEILTPSQNAILAFWTLR